MNFASQPKLLVNSINKKSERKLVNIKTNKETFDVIFLWMTTLIYWHLFLFGTIISFRQQLSKPGRW